MSRVSFVYNNTTSALLALAACAWLGACVGDEAGQLAELRTPEPASQPSPELASKLTAQAERAQAYLDEHVIPELDRALRETAGVSYAQLQAEVAEIVAGSDPDAVEAGLERFHAARGGVIDAAFARMGTTAEALGEQIQRAALGDEPQVAALAQLPPQRQAACSAGFEFEPFPPYFQAGTSFAGTVDGSFPTANVNGTLHAEAYVFTGPGGSADAWVRADNIPPGGASSTTVLAEVSFANNLYELSLWVPSYVTSGVGLTIELFDNGPSGTLLASCHTTTNGNYLLYGYSLVNRPTTITYACSVHHASSSFLTAKVHVDAFGTNLAPLAGFARALGDASVRSIRYKTCPD